MADSAHESTMDRILQEISAVGLRLEGLDSTMISLTADTKSIRTGVGTTEPEDLHSFLDGLSPKETSTLNPPRDPTVVDQNALPEDLAPGGSGFDCHRTVSHPRGRDLERPMNSHDDRGQVLHAVVSHMQVADRDRSRFPLEPSVEPS
ncbi:hypothetical protein NDU88_004830 [Pleurodeles waltl]|uniref:Uncharacterized protein n=1 Tax=Pleurodeles waltl TaxID=8319 RepID=A0AAV7TT16_PLEWA|nr:hypothetical protein NDU88_004830 [Pleurodeles waltl]